MGADHPIAWEHEFDGGRAWYTQGGHTTESYSEPLFLGHLLGGIQYALAKPATTSSPDVSKPAAPKYRQTISPGISAIKKVGGGKAEVFAISVKARRVSVSVRYRNCKPCRGTLRVRSQTRKLKLSGIPDCPKGRYCPTLVGVATGTSAVLPPGRWKVMVTLTNSSTGRSTNASRWVTIPKR
jgi:hypothetical protein